MRLVFFTLVLGLILAMTGVSVAQMDQSQMDQGQMDQSQMGEQQTTTASPEQFQATVQRGPVVRAGFPASYDVFVNGKFAMRVAAPAGGLSPMERAQIIADRLNQAFSAGMNWNEMSVGQSGNNWVVMLGDRVIATADTNSARAFRVQPPTLASNWARQTVVALGGSPTMIASALTPGMAVPGGVAGAGGGAVWASSPTKSVPLLSAQTGEQMGSVIVAGSQGQINSVNSVVVYMTTADNGAQVWTFVPISGTSTSGTLTRVSGVGLIGIPSSIIPTMNLTTGANAINDISQYSTRWNSTINANLGTDNLRFSAASKVVPLYSDDQNTVIGAAQVVGTTTGVGNTRAVVASSSGDTLRFMPTSSTCTPMSGSPPAVGGVVVSSLILMPSAAPGTSGAGPGMAPESTSPDMNAPEGTAPTSPDMNAPESTTPGTSGSGTENAPAAPPPADNSGTGNTY